MECTFLIIVSVCVCYYAVWDSCAYRLFESDSEEEEGEVDTKTEEEPVPKKKSAFQVRNIEEIKQYQKHHTECVLPQGFPLFGLNSWHMRLGWQGPRLLSSPIRGMRFN